MSGIDRYWTLVVCHAGGCSRGVRRDGGQARHDMFLDPTPGDGLGPTRGAVSVSRDVGVAATISGGAAGTQRKRRFAGTPQQPRRHPAPGPADQHTTTGSSTGSTASPPTPQQSGCRPSERTPPAPPSSSRPCRRTPSPAARSAPARRNPDRSSSLGVDEPLVPMVGLSVWVVTVASDARLGLSARPLGVAGCCPPPP